MTTATTDTAGLALDVARAVRAAVLPHLGRPRTRRQEGIAIGGDTTFGLDVLAENAAHRVLEERGGPSLAWYTEDRGLRAPEDPQRVLVIDPIDGTRPAGAGFESACVSIAAAPWSDDAKLGDVDEALVMEIRSGDLFRSQRGRGVQIVSRGSSRSPAPSAATRIEGSFLCYGLRGRPAVASAIVLEEVIDSAGVSGGTFDMGAAAFAMTRVVTGQLDAYLDHGQALIDALPETRVLYERIAGGAVLNNSPYDVAAALLICEEAGCVVTDGLGRPLADRPLLGSDADHQVSTIAACTPDLHAALVSAAARGIEAVRNRLAAGGTGGI